MGDSHIETLGDLIVQHLLINQIKDELRSRTGIWKNIVDPGKIPHTDMVIDADGLFGSVKIPCGRADAVDGAAVQCDEEIKFSLLTNLPHLTGPR